MATPLDRGTAFELQLCGLFEAHGYRALHNVRLAGRSGAEHQIDVYAELATPLQVIRVIVEAKAYDQPVDKDALLKLQQIVDDLGADRGVLATTSGFTTGALRMAEGRNVDLWDRDRVSRLLGEVALATSASAGGAAQGLASQGLLGIPPHITLGEARAGVEAEVAKRRRGGFLGVGKLAEELAGVELVHRPFYEVVLDAATLREERRGLRAREVVRTIAELRLSVDAHTGAIVTVDDDGRIRPTAYALPELSPDEAEVVTALRGGDFTRDDLLARGTRAAKAQQLLAGLQAKGLLESEPHEGSRLEYRIAGLLPVPTGFTSITEAFEVEPLGLEPCVIAGLARSQAGIIRAAEALVLDAAVRELSVVYYPLYFVSLQRPDGARRHELLDGLTGETAG